MQIMSYVGCVVKFLKDKQLLQPPIIASVCVDANVSTTTIQKKYICIMCLENSILCYGTGFCNWHWCCSCLEESDIHG
jgi:hypothetical protein